MSVRRAEQVKGENLEKQKFVPSERAKTNMKIIEEAATYAKQMLSQQMKGG
jgi:hypothetical protein